MSTSTEAHAKAKFLTESVEGEPIPPLLRIRLEQVVKRDVAGEARDDHGRWTDMHPMLLKDKPFDFSKLENRRFLYDPKSRELVLGIAHPTSRGAFGSHAQELSATGIPASRYDDFIRGWVSGPAKGFPGGVIHFAPPVVYEWDPKRYEGAADLIELFIKNGATKNTQLVAFGAHREQTVEDAMPSVVAKRDVSGEPRDERGRWRGDEMVPAEPGTVPIKPGYVRLYHQTSEENLKSILKNGLDIAHAKGIEGPRAVYASEHGFYGKPDSRPTIEFQVPADKWEDPFVLQDVKPADIIAGHLPWHHQARYMIENHMVADALAGKFDYLLTPHEGQSQEALDDEDDAAKALRYVKQKFNKVQKFNPYHGEDGRFASSSARLLGADIPEQIEWLHHKARSFGYIDAEEMEKKNPDAFLALAGEWRKTHPLAAVPAHEEHIDKPHARIKVYPDPRHWEEHERNAHMAREAQRHGFGTVELMQEVAPRLHKRLLEEYEYQDLVGKRDVTGEARDEHGRWAKTLSFMTKQADGTWQYEGGKKLSDVDQARMKELVVPPGWHQIMLNPDPKAEVQVIAKNKKDQVVRIYSEEHSAESSSTKFARVKALHKALPAIRQKLYSDFENKALDKMQRDTIAAVALINETGLRPGSTKDTRTTHTAYGATTLQGQHVKIDGEKLVLAFTGKKGVRINKTLHSEKLAKYLEGRLEKGKPIFDTSEGKALEYWKSIAGPNFKLKDLRTWHGTAVAWKWVKKLGTPKDEKTFKKWVTLICKKVAAHLGNTPAVAKSAYIDPAVFARLSAGMAQAFKSEDEPSMEELVTLMDEFTASEYDHYSEDWRDHPALGDDPDDEGPSELEFTKKAEHFEICNECTGGLAPWCKHNHKCADKEMGGCPQSSKTVVAKAAVEMVGDTHLMPFTSFKSMLRTHTMDAAQLVASLHTSRLSAYGFTAEAKALGMQEYAISEQLDSRICPVCKLMHGKRFKVADARDSLNDVFNVNTQDDLRSVQPWPKQNKRALAEMAAMSNDELVARNWHIPPFHPRCRGLLVHVGKVPRLTDMPSVMAQEGMATNITLIPADKPDSIFIGTEKQRAAIAEANNELKTAFLINGKENCVGWNKDGAVVVHKAGAREFIKLREEELKMLEHGFFTHNHPSSGTLSISDLVIAAERNLEQMVAIGADGSEYVAYNAVSGSSRKATMKYYKILHDAMGDVLFGRLFPLMMNTTISEAQANLFHDHMINKVLNKLGVITYDYKLGSMVGPAIDKATAAVETKISVTDLENEMIVSAKKALRNLAKGEFDDLPLG